MSDVQEKRITYSFSCPLPCNREIRVEARNFPDAVDEMIKAGAMGCRSGKKQFLCEKAHFDMPPMPERRVMGMKIVVIMVRRRTTRLVLLASIDIRLFIMDRYISMKLDIISRYMSVSSKNFDRWS